MRRMCGEPGFRCRAVVEAIVAALVLLSGEGGPLVDTA
jgi:hypothetical protein